MPDAGAVLVTRPEPGASETARRLAELDHVSVIAPMLGIEALPSRLPPPQALGALVVTSRNGLACLGPAYRHLPLWAVGNATAARARDAGFADVRSADGDAVALAALIAGGMRPSGGTLLLTTARGQGEALCHALRGLGFRVARRATYRARPARELPADAATALRQGRIGAALFFSAETARRFVHLAQAATLGDAMAGCEALAISQAVAVALQPLPWRRIRVAAKPNQDALLALL